MACLDHSSTPHQLIVNSLLMETENDFELAEALGKLLKFSLISFSAAEDGVAYIIHSLV
jgi:hypothetical protein